MKISTPLPAVLVYVGFIGIVVVATISGSLVQFILRLEADQLFNFFEGLLWTAIGLAFTWRAFKESKYRRLQIGAAVSFLLFGISDFIEMLTGAWYTPWTLFALKAACVLSFLIHLRIYMKTKKKNG